MKMGDVWSRKCMGIKYGHHAMFNVPMAIGLCLKGC